MQFYKGPELMAELIEFFTFLSAAIGPVGALFAVTSGFLFSRLSKMQDKIMSAFIADTALKERLLAAVNTLTNAVRDKR